MKKILSICLIFCVIFGVVSCADNMNPAENALIAIKSLDVDAFYSYMTSDADSARVLDAYGNLNESERETLKKLYGLIQYTVEKETEEGNGQKTVSLTVKHPDMARVRTLADKKILVSAETAEAVVSVMLESGEIAGYYMAEEVFDVVLKKEDDTWKVAYREKANEAFFEMLYLVEMFTFFAQH